MRERWYGNEQLANGYDDRFTSYVNANAKYYCVGSGNYNYSASTYHRAQIGTQYGTTYTGRSGTNLNC